MEWECFPLGNKIAHFGFRVLIIMLPSFLLLGCCANFVLTWTGPKSEDMTAEQRRGQLMLVVYSALIGGVVLFALSVVRDVNRIIQSKRRMRDAGYRERVLALYKTQ